MPGSMPFLRFGGVPYVAGNGLVGLCDEWVITVMSQRVANGNMMKKGVQMWGSPFNCDCDSDCGYVPYPV